MNMFTNEAGQKGYLENGTRRGNEMLTVYQLFRQIS